MATAERRPSTTVAITAAANSHVDGVTVSPEKLRDWLNPQLGRHERVDQVVIRLTMPKTMIGKLSRKDLVAEVTADGIG